MDWHKQSIRMGTAVILLAVLLRLFGTGTIHALGTALSDPAVGSFLIYLETGRVVRPVPVAEPEEPEPTDPEPTPGQALPVFSGSESGLVYVRGTGPETVDVAAMLETELDLDLTGAEPTVLILHTHTTECYTRNGEAYTESGSYRTLDPDHNMVSVGRELARLLEEHGIGVVHLETVHDHPDYNAAYALARQSIQAALEEYPSIKLVLDLHRDAASDGKGGQFDSSAQVNGQESAQLMLLVSTDHGAWAENMNLGVKLTALLERTHPGITRGILTRASLYNQDLGVSALLVEVGAAGNTRQEALIAVEALAQALLTLSQGADGA